MFMVIQGCIYLLFMTDFGVQMLMDAMLELEVQKELEVNKAICGVIEVNKSTMCSLQCCTTKLCRPQDGILIVTDQLLPTRDNEESANTMKSYLTLLTGICSLI